MFVYIFAHLQRLLLSLPRRSLCRSYCSNPLVAREEEEEEEEEGVGHLTGVEEDQSPGHPTHTHTHTHTV